MLVVLLELLFVSIKMHKDWINCGESYFESIDSFDVDVDFFEIHISPLTISIPGVFLVFSRC